MMMMMMSVFCHVVEGGGGEREETKEEGLGALLRMQLAETGGRVEAKAARWVLNMLWCCILYHR